MTSCTYVAMTSYTHDGDHVINILNASRFLRDFAPEYDRTKFGGDWTTNKGETSCTYVVMTSYTHDGDHVINILNASRFLRDFAPEYHRTKFGGDWTTNKGETLCTFCHQPIFYQNSMN